MPQTAKRRRSAPKSVPTDIAGVARLTVTGAIQLSDTKEPPKEIRLFVKGDTRTKKGVFTFDEKAAEDVMAAAKDWGNDHSFDYDHGAFSFFSAPGGGMAAGWFKPEVRKGELWATNIEWTPKAAAHLAAREYRYFSPTFRHEPDGRITELLNVALTNNPAIKHLEPLMASVDLDDEDDENPEEEAPPMKTLLKMLGLPETATEAEATAALTALLGKGSKEVESLLSLTGKGSAIEALGVVQAWKVGAEKAAELQAQLAASAKLARDEKFNTLLSQAEKDGKFSPAQRKAMQATLDKMEVPELEAFLGALGVQLPEQQKPPASGTSPLTDEQTTINTMLGVSPEQVAKAKAAFEETQRKLGLPV